MTQKGLPESNPKGNSKSNSFDAKSDFFRVKLKLLWGLLLGLLSGRPLFWVTFERLLNFSGLFRVFSEVSIFSNISGSGSQRNPRKRNSSKITQHHQNGAHPSSSKTTHCHHKHDGPEKLSVNFFLHFWTGSLPKIFQANSIDQFLGTLPKTPCHPPIL